MTDESRVGQRGVSPDTPIIYFGLAPDEVEALLYAAGHMIRSSGACYPGFEKQYTLQAACAKLRRPLEGSEAADDA